MKQIEISTAEDSGFYKEDLFPMKPPTDQEALADYERLKRLDTSIFIKQGYWFSRSEFPESYKVDVYVDSDRTGMEASNRHHWYARMACDSLNSPSPIRSWYDKKIRKSVENSKYYEQNPKTALALRKYIASQFKPSSALALYRYFDAQSVYDPCGGWGDRLVAAMAGGIKYHCRDTNPLVIAADSAMQYMYKHDAPVSFECKGSEIDAPNEKYDIAITSPPYYKIEKYQGENSSHAIYKKFDDWMDGFLYPMIENSLESVVSGGKVVINISDVYANHTYNKIVGPLIETYKSRNPCVMGYRMAKRVNSKSSVSGIFAEPIIVFNGAD